MSKISRGKHTIPKRPKVQTYNVTGGARHWSSYNCHCHCMCCLDINSDDNTTFYQEGVVIKTRQQLEREHQQELEQQEEEEQIEYERQQYEKERLEYEDLERQMLLIKESYRCLEDVLDDTVCIQQVRQLDIYFEQDPKFEEIDNGVYAMMHENEVPILHSHIIEMAQAI